MQLIFEALKKLENDIEIEAVDQDFYSDEGTAYFAIGLHDKWVTAKCKLSCDSGMIGYSIRRDSPTYVPYGERSVLYDDGGIEVTYISAAGACMCDDIVYADEEDKKEMTREEALKFLGCTDDDLKEVERLIEDDALDDYIYYVEDYYTDSPELLPDYESNLDDEDY